jgi:ketosteroid isomerase-like protein
MKLALLLALPLLLYAFQAPDTARGKALESLANAERNFSATSEAKGFHQAFVEHMADDGLVFAPKPVNGKKLHAAAPASKALLTWYPAYADISSSLDWGYTTGPYQLKVNPESDTIAGAGFYLSVWRKQAGGQWKVAVDMGNSFSPSMLKEEAYQPTAATKGKVTKGAEEELLNADIQKVQPYDAETLIYRHGAYPYKYKNGSIRPASDVVYTNLGHELSPAADMAYTYGSYTRGAGETAEAGHYLKVWKVLDGQWKLVAHNLVPDKQ